MQCDHVTLSLALNALIKIINIFVSFLWGVVDLNSHCHSLDNERGATEILVLYLDLNKGKKEFLLYCLSNDGFVLSINKTV